MLQNIMERNICDIIWKKNTIFKLYQMKFKTDFANYKFPKHTEHSWQ